MRNRINIVLFCCFVALSAPSYSQDSAPTLDDYIIWEIQSWKPGGGHKRLSLWRDGYSEIEIVPQTRPGKPPYKPNNGWEMIRKGDTVRYVHRHAYTPNMTRKMFSRAVHAGIKRLRSFKPGKKDSGGTRVVVSLDGKRKEIVIPHFTSRYKGTKNHRRFQAVAAILGNFDTNAYALPSAKPKPVAKPKTAEPAGQNESAAKAKTVEPTAQTGQAAKPATEKPADQSEPAAKTEPSIPPPANEPVTGEIPSKPSSE